MYYYSKTKTYRTRMIIFMVLCALTINITLSLSASASGLQPIRGETIANKEDMVEYYEKESPISYPGEYLKKDVNLDKFIDIIISEAEIEEIRADVIFAQILVETDWLKFDNGIGIGQNNLGGLKDIEGNYLTFASIEEGIRANVQMLKEYSSDEPLNQEKIDLLNEIKVPQEKITYVDDLGKGNLSEESEYGETIKQYLNEMPNVRDIIISGEESAKPLETTSQIDLDESKETTSQTDLEESLEKTSQIEPGKPLEIQQEDIVPTEESKSHEESVEQETKESQQDINQAENIIDSENQTKENMTTNDTEQRIVENNLHQQVEVKTLTIDGSGYVGGSHRIRSYGTSANGVLYQFWIKDLSTNTWTMIQDYSKSSALWTPTKAGKYLYGVHIKDEKSNERLDAHLYKEITIVEAPVEVETLTIDGPAYVGSSHRIRSYGTSTNGVLYQFWIKDLSTNTWTMIQDYSKSSVSWTPTKPGNYLYGVHIKDEKSNERLDAYLYKEITIKSAEVKTLTMEGPSYVGSNHKIRSYGESANGVLYQFWIKDLSTNTWTMIQDYSKSSASWTPTKAGNYLYGVHIKDVRSNERLDDHKYIEINIEDPQPAKVTNLIIKGNSYVYGPKTIIAEAEGVNNVLYQFWIDDGAGWKIIQDYGSSNSVTWTPTKAGNYRYGVHVKDTYSNERLDNYKYISITIKNAELTSLILEGPHEIGKQHTISATGESGNGVVYQFWVDDGNGWKIIQDYSNSKSTKWTPKNTGNYRYGVHIKDIQSKERLDTYLYKTIRIDNPLYAYNSIYYSQTLAEMLNIQMNHDPQTDLYGGGWKSAKEEDVQSYINPNTFLQFTPVNDRDNPEKIQVTASSLNVRSGPSTNYGIIGGISRNQIFEIEGYTNKWYKINYYGNDGWISEDYVALIGTSRSLPIDEINSSSDEYLRVATQSGSLNVRNGPGETFQVLTSVPKDSIHKIEDVSNGWYKITINSYTGWVSGEYIEYVDYSNQIPNEMYQFLILSGSTGVTASQLNNEINEKGIFHNKGSVFVEAGKLNNINEAYLIAHAMLESGNGTSYLANGVLVDNNGSLINEDGYILDKDRNPTSQKGETPYTTVYNMFGINAKDEDPYRLAAKYAFDAGWTTIDKAILGGANWIAGNYINNPSYSQNTLYKMRWNPINPGDHQYATDMGWALKQTQFMDVMVDICLRNNIPMRFDIPTYR